MVKPWAVEKDIFMRAFDYIRSSSFEEACRLLRQSNGQRKALAGGTDLLVQIKQGKLHPKAVVSLRDIPELSFIRPAPERGVSIGAMTPLGVIETSKEILKGWPALAEATSRIGSAQVRSRATLGGNLCNAAPSADTAPILIAYGATAVLGRGKTERSILLEDFFTGPGETELNPGELLKAVHVPPPPPRSFGTYLKASRSGMDLAVVGIGILVVFEPKGEVCRDLRLVLGAVAPTPMRARESEQMVTGRRLDDELIERVGHMASEEARPISDVRSTARYRRKLVNVLTRRALLGARSWAKGGGSR